jgi:hypothetical protein
MRFPVPADMSLIDRLRLFEKTLDDKYERVDAPLQTRMDNFDDRTRLKTERAEIDITRLEFKRLFERERRS